MSTNTERQKTYRERRKAEEAERRHVGYTTAFTLVLEEFRMVSEDGVFNAQGDCFAGDPADSAEEALWDFFQAAVEFHRGRGFDELVGVFDTPLGYLAKLHSDEGGDLFVGLDDERQTNRDKWLAMLAGAMLSEAKPMRVMRL